MTPVQIYNGLKPIEFEGCSNWKIWTNFSTENGYIEHGPTKR